jgi:hypothetical protein
LRLNNFWLNSPLSRLWLNSPSQSTFVIIYNSDVTVVALMTKLAVSFTERTIREARRGLVFPSPVRSMESPAKPIDGGESQSDRDPCLVSRAINVHPRRNVRFGFEFRRHLLLRFCSVSLSKTSCRIQTCFCAKWKQRRTCCFCAKWKERRRMWSISSEGTPPVISLSGDRGDRRCQRLCTSRKKNQTFPTYNLTKLWKLPMLLLVAFIKKN